jgi:hypothetical protein
LSLFPQLAAFAALFAFLTSGHASRAQSAPNPGGGSFTASPVSAHDPAAEGFSSSVADPGAALPSAPGPDPAVAPAPAAANPQREGVPWAAVWHQPPFSRIGIGADISPLGIGIKGATPLDDYLDLRGMVNFLGYNSGRFEVEGFNLNANIHMASGGAAVDFYPWNSVWRVSGGVMLFNGNQLSTTASIVPGTSFKLGSTTFYSSTADPVSGSGVLGLHTVKPEPMASFGFGRFVPHSNRHWSFPAEIGAMYMGGPTLEVHVAGSVCTDQAQTQCSDVGSTANPVGAEFNSDLNARLDKWRHDLDKVKLYPIFSFSVVYSFNVR